MAETTTIDKMCAILKDRQIKASERTDCAVLYTVTFDQLRALYDLGRWASEIEAASASLPAPLPDTALLRQCLEALESLNRCFSTCPLRPLYAAHSSEEVDTWWMRRNADNAAWVRATAAPTLAKLRERLS